MLVEKTVIVELGESRPWPFKYFLYLNLDSTISVKVTTFPSNKSNMSIKVRER